MLPLPEGARLPLSEGLSFSELTSDLGISIPRRTTLVRSVALALLISAAVIGSVAYTHHKSSVVVATSRSHLSVEAEVAAPGNALVQTASLDKDDGDDHATSNTGKCSLPRRRASTTATAATGSCPPH